MYSVACSLRHSLNVCSSIQTLTFNLCLVLLHYLLIVLLSEKVGLLTDISSKQTRCTELLWSLYIWYAQTHADFKILEKMCSSFVISDNRSGLNVCLHHLQASSVFSARSLSNYTVQTSQENGIQQTYFTLTVY